MKTSESEIVNRLIEIGRSISEKQQLSTAFPLVDHLKHDDPFAFLLAASVNPGMTAEAAAGLPAKIKSSLGHLDPARIAEMTPDEMLSMLGKIDRKPRYPTRAARTLVEVAQQVTRLCLKTASIADILL